MSCAGQPSEVLVPAGELSAAGACVYEDLTSIFRRLVEWVWVASLPVSWG